MADEMIVVDDVDDHAGSLNGHDAPSPDAYVPASHSASTSAHAISGPATRRRVASASNASLPSDRATRSTTAKSSKPQPKLKLKLNDKAAHVSGMSFLGAYDRELDSDDEDLTFEEQFILRMPAGDDCDRLRRAVASREVGSDVWFKFKDSRRAVVHVGNSTYSSKLVDLPCIVESQKTLDNKQMFKVADICQMLVVEDRIDNEEALHSQKTFNIDEFIWPHGITPPLHWVRKRRFRKRANKRTIESVEQEVERLLEADAAAESIKFDVLENVNPDLSDSEYIEREDAFDAPTPMPFGSEAGDAPTPLPYADGADGEADEEDEDDDEGDGDIDEELAAELDLALGDGDDEDEDDEDEDDESEDEDEEDEDEEGGQERKLLAEEIRDLEAAVAKKDREIASSANPLIRKRFEDALNKLKADLENKQTQMEEIKEKQRMIKEGILSEGADTDGAGNAVQDEDEDDLFGPEAEMEIG